MSTPSRPGGLVYSTEGGRMCPQCRQTLTACSCKSQAAARVLGDGKVRVTRETSGRGGKAVTVVRGLPLDEAALQALGKQLKAACGTGGTVKEGVIEVQGDHVDKVLGLLQLRGYPAKRSGG